MKFSLLCRNCEDILLVFILEISIRGFKGGNMSRFFFSPNVLAFFTYLHEMSFNAKKKCYHRIIQRAPINSCTDHCVTDIDLHSLKVT